MSNKKPQKLTLKSVNETAECAFIPGVSALILSVITAGYLFCKDDNSNDYASASYVRHLDREINDVGYDLKASLKDARNDIKKLEKFINEKPLMEQLCKRVVKLQLGSDESIVVDLDEDLKPHCHVKGVKKPISRDMLEKMLIQGEVK